MSLRKLVENITGETSKKEAQARDNAWRQLQEWYGDVWSNRAQAMWQTIKDIASGKNGDGYSTPDGCFVSVKVTKAKQLKEAYLTIAKKLIEAGPLYKDDVHTPEPVFQTVFPYTPERGFVAKYSVDQRKGRTSETVYNFAEVLGLDNYLREDVQVFLDIEWGTDGFPIETELSFSVPEAVTDLSYRFKITPEGVGISVTRDLQHGSYPSGPNILSGEMLDKAITILKICAAQITFDRTSPLQ